MHRILAEAKAVVRKHPSLRLGQAVFNVAHTHHPRQCALLVAGPLDCFHSDERIDEFLAALEGLLRPE